MNLIPLFNRVLVERLESETQTATGILLPSAKQSNRAKVIAVGSDCKQLHPGDIIILTPHAGMPIEEAGQTYLLLREEEIVAKELGL